MKALEKMRLLVSVGFKQVNGSFVKPSKNNVGWTWNVTVADDESMTDKVVLKDQYGREQDEFVCDYAELVKENP